MLDTMTLGTRIRAAREAKDWNQTDLAERLGVERETISQIERGIIKSPTVDRILELAEALEVSPCWLAFNAGTMYAIPHSNPEPIDADLLSGIIEVIQGLLGRRKISLPARNYGRLIALCYEHEAARPQTSGIDRNYILKLFELHD